jgi:hypothetical protein
MSIGMGGADDVYNVSVNVDMAAAVPQFNQFQNAVNNTSSQFINLNRNISITHQSSQSLMGSMTGLIGTAAGIGILVRTVRELTGAFAEASKEAAGIGADTSKWQQSLRELQTASGRPEALSAEVQQTNLGLMRVGLRQGQALGFQRTFAGEAAEGYTPDAQGKTRYSKQKYNQVMTRVAQVAVAMGGDPKEFSQLAGRYLSMYGDTKSVDEIVEMTVSTFQKLGFAPGQTTALLGQFTNALSSNVFAGPGGNVDSPDRLAGLMFGVATGLPAGRVGTATSIVAGAVSGVTKGSKKFEEWLKTVKGYREDMDAADKIMLATGKAQVDLKMPDAEMDAALKELAEEGEGAEGEGSKRVMKYFSEKGLASAPAIRALSTMTANRSRMKRVMEMPRQGIQDINKDIEATMQSPEMQKQLASTNLEAERLQQGMRYQAMDTMMEWARGEMIKQGIDTPEMRGPEAMADFMAGRGITGLPKETTRKLQAMTIRKAIDYYGADFQHPALEDRKVTEGETYAGFADFSFPRAMQEAEERRQRRGSAAGPGALGTQVDMPDSSFNMLGDLPGPAQVGQSAVHILGQMFPFIARMAENTEPLKANVPLPQNAPDPKR